MRFLFLLVLFLFFYIDCIEIRIQVKSPKLIEEDINLNKKIKIINAIFKVESNLTSNIINHKEQARGIAQIRPIAVKEVNRIIGYDKYDTLDCYCIIKSIQMFMIIQDYYNPDWEYEAVARLWNGGPNWKNKESTKKYYEKVLRYL